MSEIITRIVAEKKRAATKVIELSAWNSPASFTTTSCSSFDPKIHGLSEDFRITKFDDPHKKKSAVEVAVETVVARSLSKDIFAGELIKTDYYRIFIVEVILRKVFIFLTSNNIRRITYFLILIRTRVNHQSKRCSFDKKELALLLLIKSHKKQRL